LYAAEKGKKIMTREIREEKKIGFNDLHRVNDAERAEQI